MVSIIIVNYNTLELTRNCIKSIIQYTHGIDYEIILVDNASTDGSKDFFEKNGSITYIYSPENLGFGRANNLGVKDAGGNFLFLLNSDTILTENSIKKIHDFFSVYEAKLKIGVLGVLLIDKDNNFVNSGGPFPTIYNNILHVFQVMFKAVKPYNLKIDSEYQEIGMVSGADLFMKKSLFEEVKGFDETFFMYYEQTDLQRRIFKLGFRNFLLNTTRIIHLEGGSFAKRESNRKRIMIQTSRNRYFRKNFKIAFPVFVVFDCVLNFVRLKNTSYTLAENIEFIKANIKSYFQ